MVSIVSNRFVLVVQEMKRKGLIKSYKQFALDIDYFPQGMNSILKGEREASVEMIRKAAQIFPINLDFLFFGKGDTLKDAILNSEESGSSLVKVPVFTPDQIHMLSTYVTNRSIYVSGFLHVPALWFSKANIVAIQVVKDTMSPVLHAGDFVFCSEVDRYQLRSGNIYGVLEKNEILFCRYRHRVESKFLVFTQDVFADSEIKISEDDILTVFEVERKVTSVLTIQNKLSNQISKELQYLHITSEEQLENMKNLNKSMETLLKQIRLNK